nr:MAG TPA: hypothetical protein [Caudoviricetes sp.]
MPGRWHLYLQNLSCRMTLKLGFAVVTPRLKTRQKKGI